MSSKARRRIRPHERARVDQYLAAARNRGAAEPRTAVFATEYADPGVQCCWCDCTLEDHLEFGDCAGCPCDALFVVHTYGALEQCSYPTCERHHPDFVRFWSTVVLPGVPADIQLYDAYDADIDRR